MKARGVEVDVVNMVPYIPRFLGFISDKIKRYSNIPRLEQYDGITVYHPKLIRSNPYDALDKLLFHILSFQSGIISSVLMDWIDIKKYQVIHAHNLFPDGVIAYLLYKRYDIPYVITLHDVDKFNRFPKRGWQRKISRLIIDHADRVFVVSNRVRDNILPYVENERIQVLYNTFWTEERAQNLPKAKNIVTIASLIERKGIHVLLEAFYRVTAKHEDYHLTIIGNGSQLEPLKSLTRKFNLENKVTFTGTLAHQEAMDKLSRASVFCLPSWNEAFGVVYAEAMSYGIPIIGCKGEGIADIVCDRVNGMLVEPHDVDELEHTILSLIESPEYALKIGLEGKTKIRELHPDLFGEKLKGIYQEILAAR
ncbi:glycosyltransferase [Cohnella sp. NL03-T5]|nr:glycosyltransferase [Cohnella silvisoli]